MTGREQLFYDGVVPDMSDREIALECEAEAREAYVSHSWDAASEKFEEAAELWESYPHEPGPRLQAICKSGACLWYSGDLDGALDCYQRQVLSATPVLPPGDRSSAAM